MNPRPFVSVIIAAFNAEEYVVKAISSVLSQTLSQVEVIVVDDASTDATVARVNSIRDDRVRLYAEDINRGPSFCRNYAIERSQGDWIAILDSDDWWDPTRLEVLLQYGENLDIVCDDLYLVADEGLLPKTTYLKSREAVIGRVSAPRMITPLMMVHDDYGVLQPLVRTDFLRKNSIRYKDHHRFGEDFVFLLDCLMAGAKMMLYPVPYYYYRTGHASSSASSENPIGQCALLEELMTEPRYREIDNIMDVLQEKLSRKRLIVEELRAKQLFHNRKFVKGITTVLQHPGLLVGYARSIKTKMTNPR